MNPHQSSSSLQHPFHSFNNFQNYLNDNLIVDKTTISSLNCDAFKPNHLQYYPPPQSQMNGFLNELYPIQIPCVQTELESNKPIIDSVGTIILPCDNEIQDVTMVDDYEAYDPENLSLLDFDERFSSLNNDVTIRCNNDDEQEYWKNTRDCDYRCLALNNKNDDSNEIPANDLPSDDRPKRIMSRKKKKKIHKKLHGIDLTKKTLTKDFIFDENSLDSGLDELNFEDLISIKLKLQSELAILNSLENDNFSSIKTQIQAASHSTDQELNQMSINQQPYLFDNVSCDQSNINSPSLEIESSPQTTETSGNNEKVQHQDETDKSPDINVKSLEENFLREKLIRSLLEKRLTPSSTGADSDEIIENKSSNPAQIDEPINTKAIAKPIIDLSKYKLVIQISDDETESSESAPESSNYSATNLNKYELKLKTIIEEMRQKSLKTKLLGKKLAEMKNKFKESRNHYEKSKKLFLVAQKRLKLDSVQMHLMAKNFNDCRLSLTKNNETFRRYQSLCSEIGNQLYGKDYALPYDQSNQFSAIRFGKKNQSNQTNVKTMASLKNYKRVHQSSLQNLRTRMQHWMKESYSSDTIVLLNHCVNFNYSLFKTTAFFQSNTSIPFSDFTATNADYCDLNILQNYPNADSEKVYPNHENYQSVLMHFNSYRFSVLDRNLDISSDFWSNMLNINETICHYDLMGSCNDVNCRFQHRKDYLLGTVEKILDVLTYSPEFASQINVEEIGKNPKLLLEKMFSYLRSKRLNSNLPLEMIGRELSEQIRKDRKMSTHSLLIRCFPKDFIKLSDSSWPSVRKQIKVPFEDHVYRFNIRDDRFDLKLSHLVNYTMKNDPDFHIKNRFFAPEGVPITAQLESSLSNDPHNIQMWINLAYYHLSRVFDHNDDLDQCFDSALNVLSRGLECNRNDGELYEHYLLLYVNKYDSIVKHKCQQNMIDIQEICRRILKHCSNYRLWIDYLNVCSRIDDKNAILMEMLDQYVEDNIQYCSEEERSFNLIEIILNRINLLLHQNKFEESVMFFNNIFQNFSTENPITKSSKLCSLISSKHRAFAWHCYINVILYRRLPYHCFQLSKRGCFLRLINAVPFIFDWKMDRSQNDLRIIKKILIRALKSCCSEEILKCSCMVGDQNPMETCFSLRLNLTNLNKILFRDMTKVIHNDDDDMENSYYLPFLFKENCEVLNNLHILHMFEIMLNLDKDMANNETLNFVENYYNSNNHDHLIDDCDEPNSISLLQSQLKFNYWLTFCHMKLKNWSKCKEILRKSLTNYFDTLPQLVMQNCDDLQLLQLYEVILFDSMVQENDLMKVESIKFNLKFKKSKKSHHLVYLYLSYMLLVHINAKECSDGNQVEQDYLKLECVFSSIINSFLTHNPQSQDQTKILWFNYFLLLLDFPYSDEHFKMIYENLRHICLNFNSNDPILIYHLINSISDFINPSDKLYFMIDLCKLNWDNMNLLLNVFQMAWRKQKKETLWNLIIEMVFKKNIQLQCLEFWKIAISLSIERNDHLNAHRFFQIALSLMPYNITLWEMFKNYETSIDHQEHLNQMKSFLADTLGMTITTTVVTNDQ